MEHSDDLGPLGEAVDGGLAADRRRAAWTATTVTAGVVVVLATAGGAWRLAMIWSAPGPVPWPDATLAGLWLACACLGAGAIFAASRGDRRYRGALRLLTESQRQRGVMAERLREREQELWEFFDNATLGMHWVGPEGRILRANRTELEMLGYAREEYVGRCIREFHADRAVIDDVLTRLARGEVVHSVAARLRCRDGSVRHVVMDGGPIRRDGQFVHSLCFTRDLTEARRAESEMRQLRGALEHAVEGIARIDAQGRILSVNPAYAAMYGCTPEEMVGAERASFIHREDDATLAAAARTMVAEGKAEVDVRGVRRDGSIFYQRATLAATRGADGSVSGWYAFAKDVTQRRLAERQLRESFARQQELFRREKTLLRELNHRVRNNLAGLLGLVGLYERSGKSAPEMGAALRGKIKAMKEVHDMISRTHGTPVDLASLVARLAGDLCGPDESVRIGASGPPVDVPHSQAVALAMVFQELLTNARKYGALSAPEGRVDVSWEFEEGRPGLLLRLSWTESGGPGPAAGAGQPPGVGMSLIEGLAGAELQGRCSFCFEPAGLCLVLETALDGAGVARPVPA